MSVLATKYDIAQKLQKDILALQGVRKKSNQHINTDLGEIESAFHNHTFPTGAVHEFISYMPEASTATNGFIAALMGKCTDSRGTILWISMQRTIFPPALQLYGIDPGRVLFLDLASQKDVLWAVEEALKCDALAGVVSELRELTFTESRRLQLAVEQSKVTGFIHRYNPRSENITACVTRWKIQALPSILEEGMPGIGLPKWNVQLMKVRNGKPGSWHIEWKENGFKYTPKQAFTIHHIHKRKTG